MPVPAARDLPKLSETVWRNLRRDAVVAARLPARPGQAPRAIPERIGEREGGTRAVLRLVDPVLVEEEVVVGRWNA